jgi:hypothetical protein
LGAGSGRGGTLTLLLLLLLLLLLGLLLLLLLWMLLHDGLAAVRRYYRRFAQAVYGAVCSLSVNRSAAVVCVEGTRHDAC